MRQSGSDDFLQPLTSKPNFVSREELSLYPDLTQLLARFEECHAKNINCVRNW